ncbi:MAG: hypothetical protein LBJ17_04570 [Dysgonamonadaceae bacterium]|jgi:hypothetical protein|nr:hypothetical protein [Dysgonamonadaceae bacterium]
MHTFLPLLPANNTETRGVEPVYEAKLVALAFSTECPDCSNFCSVVHPTLNVKLLYVSESSSCAKPVTALSNKTVNKSLLYI